MYTTNSVLRSWTKLFVGTPRLSVNLQRKTWSGGTKWPQPIGRNLFFIRLKSQVLLCAVEICSHENLPPGSLWQIFNYFFQATLNYSHDVGGGQTWQADIWKKNDWANAFMQWSGMQLGNLSCVLLLRNLTVQEYLTGQSGLGRKKSFLFKVSFVISSSCAYDSWRLRVPENTQRSLDYWSSDWKYRCSLYISFHFEKCAPTEPFSEMTLMWLPWGITALSQAGQAQGIQTYLSICACIGCTTYTYTYTYIG